MPELYILGGPNGAGKTTTALTFLPQFVNCREFVNADLLAQGISPFQPETVARRAGRLMLERLNELETQRVDFAFETTMASRTFAPFLKRCQSDGYNLHLLFVWLNSPDLAVARVAQRVQSGGHFVPEEIVRRRYERGRRNFLDIYLPLAATWRVTDNSSVQSRLVASGARGAMTDVYDLEAWSLFSRRNDELTEPADAE